MLAHYLRKLVLSFTYLDTLSGTVSRLDRESLGHLPHSIIPSLPSVPAIDGSFLMTFPFL